MFNVRAVRLNLMYKNVAAVEAADKLAAEDLN
jgi:hypothetical protein